MPEKRPIRTRKKNNHSIPKSTDLPAPECLPASAGNDSFLNRDLSWLDFNHRVLHEAADTRNPLLERVRFLGIFRSNLDEFFMKRVSLLRPGPADVKRPNDVDGLPPDRNFPAVRARVIELLSATAGAFSSLLPLLTQHNIHLLRWADLSEAERLEAADYFKSSLYPILTPLAVDPGHPFPFISNLSENVGVILHHPEHPDDNLFARIKVPESTPRWIPLKSSPVDASKSYRFVSLYDVIRQHLESLFPGMLVADVMLFRITRNAELDLFEEETEDLRTLVEQELRERRFADVVRLEHGPNPSKFILQFLADELDLTNNDIYEIPGGLEFADLKPIPDLPIPSLRFDPWIPVIPPALSDEDADIFGVIRNSDVLVHHPYESFSASVERFVTAASADPKVLAIKMTLYRTGDDSPFIDTLIQAAERNKQVVCMVELKARFDEQRNIVLARKLEKAGVHVVYGIVGLKTHTKTILVVRQDTDRIRCYAHIGTGNYNTQTAKLYTDLGLLTANPDITGELVELFHHLTGRSFKQDYRTLMVAPVNMRQRFLELIDREITHQKAGRPSHIIAKMNSLEDRRIICALYNASQAGVPVDLIVRGFCCLRPGVAGLSDNIRVTSVIGRFLEHSRVFYFRNGTPDPADGDTFIGSADWMYRNLLARVEVVTPILDRPHRARILDILQILLKDTRQAWTMNPNGSYTQRTAAADDPGTHQTLMTLARQRTIPRV